MSNSIDDLRTALFATLEAVKAGTMNLDQARSVNEIARTIVESAKVEVDFIRATDGTDSKFLRPPAAPALPPGITGIHQHRIGG